MRNKLASLFDNQIAVKIGAVVDAIFDGLAVLILEIFRRTPPFGVNVERDLDDFVRCEKAVLNTLLERIGIERIAEILGA